MMKPAPAIRLCSLVLSLLLPGAARAADVALIGDPPYSSLPLAVAAARSNDIVVLVADAVLDDALSIPLPLTIRSDGHPRTITRTAAATNDLITVFPPGALVLGAPDASDAAPTHFLDGAADAFPGVTNAGSFVYAVDASVTVHPGVVFQNWRGLYSPLYAETTNSSAPPLSVLGGTFRDNHSATWGGAIYAAAVPTIIQDATFLRNSSAGQAGAVGVQYASLDLARVFFVSNSAVLAGGALFAWNASARVADSIFTDNACSSFNGRGGAAFLEATTLDLSGTDFLGNAASESGGALCLVDCPDATLSASVFASNSVPYGEGGALYAYSSSLSADGLGFSSNSAWAAGGAAVLVKSDSSFRSASVTSNASLNGAGFYVSEGAIDISSSAFSANATSGDGGVGGALYLAGTTNADLLWTVAGSAFSANSAVYGGAVYAAYATGSATASSFSSNSATAGGGALWSFADTVLADDAFFHNSAAAEGGAVFHIGGPLRLAGASRFTGNSASNGPSLWSYNGSYESNAPAILSLADAVSFDAPIALHTAENAILLPGVLTAPGPLCAIAPPAWSNGLSLLSDDPSSALSFSPISRYYAKFAVLPDPDGNPWFIDAAGCLASVPPPTPPLPPDDLRVFEAVSPASLQVPSGLLAYDFSLQSATTLSNGVWNFAPCGRACLVATNGVVTFAPETADEPFRIFRLAFE